MLRVKGLAAAAVLVTCAALFPSAGAADRSLYSVEVSHAGPAALRALKADPDVSWWVELGDLLVVSGTDASLARASRAHATRALAAPAGGERLYVGHRAHGDGLAAARVLASSGVFALVAAAPETAAEVEAHEPGQLAPLVRNHVYARSTLNDPEPARPLEKGADAARYAGAVDAERWRRTVADLVAFETRYTGTAGALGARDYIAAEFARIGLEPEIESFPVNGTTGHNVLAEVRGTARPDDVYVVCGHYDSTAESGARETNAPGAEDNASGAAAVLELARVFAADPPAATVRFVCFSGEEQGLYGSRRYVDDLVASNEDERVKAAINMDMIAFSADGDLDVLLETAAVGRDLSDALASAAAEVTSLRVVKSFNPFGSDHVPFLDAGIPCVLTIENDWDQYPDYHTSRDTMANVRLDMGSQVVRMNAATLGALAAGGDGGGGGLTADVPIQTNRATLYGGFVQPVTWTVEEGAAFASFDVEYSLDGVTFQPAATGLGADARSYAWVVPSARANRARVRVVGHLETGETAADANDAALKLRPGNGPVLKAVKFKSGPNHDLFLKGRFTAQHSQVLVDGEAVGSTIVEARDIFGNTSKRIYVQVGDLDAVFPPGVPVRVSVVEAQTGRTTNEITVTR